MTQALADLPCCHSLRYLVGLDLGQSRDPTALVVASRTVFQKDAPGVFDVRHVERLELGTSYPKVVAHAGALVHRPELRPTFRPPDSIRLEEAPRPTLALDWTGPGRPVADLFVAAKFDCDLAPVAITSGLEARHERKGGITWHYVPKRALASNAMTLLQTQRLRFAANLPLSDLLRQELLNFKVRTTVAGNEVFESVREREHDDIVLALMLALWVGEYRAARPVRASADPLAGYRGTANWPGRTERTSTRGEY